MGDLARTLGCLALGLLGLGFVVSTALSTNTPIVATQTMRVCFFASIASALVALPVGGIAAVRKEPGAAAGLALSLIALTIAFLFLLAALALQDAFESGDWMLG